MLLLLLWGIVVELMSVVRKFFISIVPTVTHRNSSIFCFVIMLAYRTGRVCRASATC